MLRKHFQEVHHIDNTVRIKVELCRVAIGCNLRPEGLKEKQQIHDERGPHVCFYVKCPPKVSVCRGFVQFGEVFEELLYGRFIAFHHVCIPAERPEILNPFKLLR